MKRLCLLIITALFTFGLVGCDIITPPTEHDSRLVGTFLRTNTQGSITTTVTYVFNSDGTGTMTANVNGTVNGPNALTWRTYNGVFYHSMQGDSTEYDNVYSIDSSNNFVLGSYTYIRQ